MPPLDGIVLLNSGSKKGFSVLVLTLAASRKILAIVLQKLCGVNPSEKNAIQKSLSRNPVQENSKAECGTKTTRMHAIANRPTAGPDEGSAICSILCKKSCGRAKQQSQRPASTRAEDMLLLPASPDELAGTIAQFPCSIAPEFVASTLKRGKGCCPTLTALSDRMKLAKGSCRNSVKTPSGSRPIENALTSFDLKCVTSCARNTLVPSCL